MRDLGQGGVLGPAESWLASRVNDGADDGAFLNGAAAIWGERRLAHLALISFR